MKQFKTYIEAKLYLREKFKYEDWRFVNALYPYLNQNNDLEVRDFLSITKYASDMLIRPKPWMIKLDEMLWRI